MVCYGCLIKIKKRLLEGHGASDTLGRVVAPTSIIKDGRVSSQDSGKRHHVSVWSVTLGSVGGIQIPRQPLLCVAC